MQCNYNPNDKLLQSGITNLIEFIANVLNVSIYENSIHIKGLLGSTKLWTETGGHISNPFATQYNSLSFSEKAKVAL